MNQMLRRDFFKTAAAAAAAAALPKYSMANLAADQRLKIAIVGCGRSGFNAAKTLMEIDDEISITSLADAFEDCAISLHKRLSDISSSRGEFALNKYAVKQDTIFTGLDCCQKALQTNPDIIVLATPPVFRPDEVKAAVAKNVHIFMEKPVCVDPVQARRMYALAKEAEAKKLTVISGVQRRYHAGYREAVKRLQDGQIGEILGAQCFWMLPHFDGMDLKTPPDADPEQLEYQLRNWGLFTWTCGDHIVEQQVHNLDVINWALNRDPKFVNGIGGRALSLPMPQYGNRFSHFSIDYDYGADVHLQSVCRQEPSTSHLVLERIFGTKGVFETNLFSGQQIRGENNWIAGESPDPAIEMHRTLLKSVRNGEAVNTMKTMTDSSMLAIAGRLSAYSGLRFKYKWAKLRSKESLFDGKLEFGKKPIAPLPVPGEYKLV